MADENFVQGQPTVYVQDMCHIDEGLEQSRHRDSKGSDLPDRIAQRLHELGLLCPHSKSYECPDLYLK